MTSENLTLIPSYNESSFEFDSLCDLKDWDNVSPFDEIFNSSVKQTDLFDKDIEAMDKSTHRNSFQSFPKTDKLEISRTQSILTLDFSFLEGLSSEATTKAEIKNTPKQRSIKKHSLKFCRKLSRLMLSLTANSTIIAPTFNHFERIIEDVAVYLSANILNKEELARTHVNIFRRIWLKQRATLSHITNRSICLVTDSEWEQLFSRASFLKKLREESYDYQCIFDLVIIDIKNKQAFLHIYERTLFMVNKILLYFVLCTNVFKDEDFKSKVMNYADFGVMTLEPTLYYHYNHSKGKFAIECCNKCKICRSSVLPKDYLSRVKEARQKYNSITALYERLAIKSNFMTKEQIFELLVYFNQAL